MEKIIKELEKGNIEILSLIHPSKIPTLFCIVEYSENKDKILKTILPKLMKLSNWYGIAQEIFHLIYLNDEYKEYVYYLLSKEIVKPEDLNEEEVENLFIKKNWGFHYVLDNAERIVNVFTISLVTIIIENTKNNEELFRYCLKKILYSKDDELRANFIFYSEIEGLLPNEDYIVASLYQNPDEYLYEQVCLSFIEPQEKELFLSRLPYYLSTRAHEEKYKNLLMRHYQEFFMAEEGDKLRLIERLGYVSSKINEKYYEILRVFENTMLRNNYSYLMSSLINLGEEEIVTKYTAGEEIKYETSGTQAKVFKVGEDKVIKLSKFKYNKNTVTEHFLLAPTEINIINGIYIEKQAYLKKEYNGKKMTRKDIENFLKEAARQGLEINDPLCRDKKNDNFGFLNSYKDASLVGVESHEDLPEWFKKRPIVLYDIDMVTYTEENKKQLVK